MAPIFCALVLTRARLVILREFRDVMRSCLTPMSRNGSRGRVAAVRSVSRSHALTRNVQG